MLIQLEEKTYTRLSQLHIEPNPIDLKTGLEPGDCLITFSVRGVHKMKNLINKIYAKSQKNLCAVIYGRLPPENRKYQTLKFNSDDSGFEYLVATNAVINNIFLFIFYHYF